MDLFNRKKEEKKQDLDKKNAPQGIPTLPKLPDFLGFDQSREEPMGIQKLPSLPSTSLGRKFSQNTIKDAVSGYNVDENEDTSQYTENFTEEEEEKTLPEPLKKPMTKEFNEVPPLRSKRGFENEPVFVRVDKFEGAISAFEEVKRKITDVEKALEEIKEIREKEERELQSWENEIKAVKEDMEKIDQDIFSKL